MTKTSKFWIAFAVGAALSFTNLIAPLHELGHLRTAIEYNDEAKITSWSTTRAEIRLSQAYAGYFFEIWIMILLGILVLPVKWLPGGFVGYAQFTWFRAFGSTDFNSYVERVIEYYNLNDVNAQHIRSAVVQGWIVRGVILFGIVWTIMYFVLRKKREISPA